MARTKGPAEPKPGDTVRVFPDGLMVDEPARVVRVNGGGLLDVEVRSEEAERYRLSEIQWCGTVDAALAHGARSAFVES